MIDQVSIAGIENLKFKPTYNPYTEPSMEIFAYHDGLKKVREGGMGKEGLMMMEKIDSFVLDYIRLIFCIGVGGIDETCLIVVVFIL